MSPNLSGRIGQGAELCPFLPGKGESVLRFANWSSDLRESGAMLDGLTIADGAAVGAWIGPRLEGGFGGKVEQLVPNGYDAYIRILHPAGDFKGNRVTWAEVAEAKGRTTHREMQWHKIVGPRREPIGSEWPEQAPGTGELDDVSLGALCRILGSHTADPDRCFFGLSTIYGNVEETYPEAVLLRFPGRDYVVFSGSIDAANQVGYESRGSTAFLFASTGASSPSSPKLPDWDPWQHQPPNLIWPSDHSWYVASEYDMDSTLVGGSSELIEAIMAAPELETWVMRRDDSLQDDADQIN